MSKKELIRTTAIDLFATKGYYNTSTPMIAEAAQISVGTIYNYFKNKEEILDYIFCVEHDIYDTFLTNLEKVDLPLRDKIKIYIDKYYSMMLVNPNNTEVTIKDSRHPTSRKLEYVNKTLNHLPQYFINILSAAQLKGEIPDIKPSLVGPAIFYTIRGMAYTIQKNLDEKDYDKAINEIKIFINSALRI